jgi:uncharacterized protein (TIGR02118 family)
MIRVSVLYRQPRDPLEFERHYTETHIPLALNIPDVLRLESAKTLPGPDGVEPVYFRVADVWFANLQRMQAAMESAEWRAIAADLPNFATGGFMVLTSQVTAARGALTE